MEADFWRLLDATRPGNSAPSAHAEALVEHLVSDGTRATLRFAEQFDRALDRLHRWDLWGAAYLTFAGCGDDAFEYLRCWLIGMGHDTWDLAASDPETLFVSLVGETNDVEDLWDILRIDDAERLLYVASDAHERLTGERLTTRYQQAPAEPIGQEWDEKGLPTRFPALNAVLPEGWWDGAGDDFMERLANDPVYSGLIAFADGGHVRSAGLLGPVVDDPKYWNELEGAVRVEVGYAAGMSRLVLGDVDSAARALHLLDDALGDAAHVRRGLAQVELARGELAAAAALIDETGGRLDRALAAKLAWRSGRQDEAVQRACDEIELAMTSDEHAWETAGALLQNGRILADAGDAGGAERAVSAITPLLQKAPDELPLLKHLRLLEASVMHLRGEETTALAALDQMVERSDGSDLAECLRERARVHVALENTASAESDYLRAIELFTRAGERWEAETTRGEAGL